ncbi:SAYSvFN domain-containing protein 1 [Pseudolycoriella hygida]|uniref:SAYSvFN domain-containing protein 1 n=1 Tax=Pseudolycoriella hygida TaxID=35572 RepID=A0A9Q0MUB0_9DIPT|nr:SAYSvFN domain-containing protein 1 [Pseudolycoriella hygida]
MEAKLESYRIRKRRRAVFDQIKNKFFKMVSFNSNKAEKDEHVIEITETLPPKGVPDTKTKEIYLHDVTPVSSDDEDGSLVKPKDSIEKQRSWLTYFTYCLYFLFWATCYVIAIELKFGTVYFLFSALFAVYFNTRTGKKHENEISAYSVFNKNCHSIDGTLKAEQFEREIRYGPTGVK